jgi:hypothetical protein
MTTYPSFPSNATTSRREADVLAGLALQMPLACAGCGTRAATVTPHLAIACDGCGARRGSLSATTSKFLLELVRCFGAIHAPVVLRRPAPSDKC